VFAPVANQTNPLAQAFRAQADVPQEKEEKEMSFTVKAKCKFGDILHRLKTPAAALRKANFQNPTVTISTS
jgi:hypothetical protein